MPRTLKLVIAYDGSNYAGWQRQANATAIQQVLEEEIAVLIGTHRPLNAAGRTDTGVHAAAQVASITIDHPISCDELMRALNARNKAGDIRIRSIEVMPDRWDARIFAKSKSYRYSIWSGPKPSPFMRQLVWHVPQDLDLARMQLAAQALVGEHDFVAFQRRSNDVRTTVRRVLDVAISETEIDTDQLIALSPLDPTRSLAGDSLTPAADGDARESAGRLIRLEISGTGFLRHMVRTIAGTLVEIGRGLLPVEEMAAIIESRDRARAGQTAPPQGLMLWKVTY
jgi:tRNA pseudouridine38-40 synthase